MAKLTMKQWSASFFMCTILGALSIPGCGDQGTTVTPMTLDEYNKRNAELNCSFMFSCCDMTERAGNFTAYGITTPPQTEAECVPLLVAAFDKGYFAEMKESVAAGRIKFDGTQAAICDSKMPPIECNATSTTTPDPSCDKILTPLVANDGDCASTFECVVAESACTGVTPDTLGKCKPLPKEGEPCPTTGCAQGLVCLVTNTSVCIKLKANGEMCENSGYCGDGYCDAATSLCTARKANGAACTETNECSDGYCDLAVMTCTARKPAGQPCTSHEECQFGECDATTSTCSSDSGPGPLCDGI